MILHEEDKKAITEAVHRIIGYFYTLAFSCAAGLTTYYTFTLAGAELHEIVLRSVFVSALSAMILHDYIYEGTSMHILKEESDIETVLQVKD